MILYILIAVAVLAWLYVGSRINNDWYQEKLDGFEKVFFRDWGEEFSDGKRSFWSILMVLAWPFVLIYETATDFRQWKYPHCSAEAMHNIRSAKPAKRRLSLVSLLHPKVLR